MPVSVRRVLLVGAITTLPLEAIATADFGLRISVSYVFGLLLVAASVFESPASFLTALRRRDRFLLLCLVASAAWGLVNVPALSSTLSTGAGIRVSSLRPILQLGILTSYVLFGAAVRCLSQRREDLEFSLSVLGWTSLAVTALALYQSFAVRLGLPFGELGTARTFEGRGNAAFWTSTGLNIPRIRGTFVEPKGLALFLLLAVIIFFLGYPRCLRRWSLILIVLALFGIAATVSLAAIAAIPVVLLLATVVSYTSRTQGSEAHPHRWLAALCLALTVISVLPLPGQQRLTLLEQILERQEQKTTRHTEDALSINYTLWSTSPVLGVGLGWQPVLIADQLGEDQLGIATSGFVGDLGVEGGPILAVAALWFVVGPAFDIWRRPRNAPFVRRGLAIFLLAWAVQSVSWGGALMILALVAGLAESGRIRAAMSPGPERVPPSEEVGRP